MSFGSRSPAVSENSRQMPSTAGLLAWPAAVIFIVTSALLALLVFTRPERIVEVEIERRVEIPVEIHVEKPVGRIELLSDDDRHLHQLGKRLDAASWTSSPSAISGGARTPAADGHLVFPLSLSLAPALEQRVSKRTAEETLRRILKDGGIRVEPNATLELEIVSSVMNNAGGQPVIICSLDVVKAVLVERSNHFSWTRASLHSDWLVRLLGPSEISAEQLESIFARLLEPIIALAPTEDPNPADDIGAWIP